MVVTANRAVMEPDTALVPMVCKHHTGEVTLAPLRVVTIQDMVLMVDTVSLVPDPGMVDMVQGVVTDKWVTTTSNMREDQHEVVRTKGLVAATIRTVNRLLCFRFLNNF